MKLVKASKVAKVIALLYVLLVITVFLAHIYSVKTNAADSGESAIPLYLLALPWIKLIPASFFYSTAWGWLAYPALWLCVSLNGFFIYYIISRSALVISYVRRMFID